MWDLDLGLKAVRKIEEIVAPLKAHAALAGGVMKNGSSTNDLDIIIYNHCTAYRYDKENVINTIAKKLDVKEVLPFTLKYKDGGDEKDVRVIYLKSGRRIDLFLL